MASRLDFQVSFNTRGQERARDQAEPLRLLVIADLRGAGRVPEGAAPGEQAQAKSLAAARVLKLSVDNFDAVLASFSPAVELASRAGEQSARRHTFAALSDFHPDALYDSLEALRALRESRARLGNPQTFASERARLLADSVQESAPEGRQSAPEESTASTLGRLLGGPVSRPSGQASAASSAIDDLLRAIVAPHVKASLLEQKQLMASIESALSSALRAVLHDPGFQRLEASFRALDWLVRDNALGAELEISVLDASRAELAADLRACGGALERSTLYRLVVEQEVLAAGGRPFAMIVGDLYFDGSEADVSLLAGLGALAAQAGGAFVAGALPSLVGCHDLPNESHWSSWSQPDPAVAARMSLLRKSPVAPFIGLALPRLIGRVPYGKGADPIERFDFSELSADAEHAHYLWINPAFGCAQLLAAAFAADGWDFRLGSTLELSGLSLAVQLGSDGERIKPCAEVCLDASSAERMLQQGLMPWLSYKNQNAARLLCFQSIAEPASPLLGPWRP